ncbi:MAG: endolytic transglycosylase MltG [Rickettsiaceae bacterium]|nr:endolytic transglycosylase MltG [Rickettsiaceae bacterium]
MRPNNLAQPKSIIIPFGIREKYIAKNLRENNIISSEYLFLIYKHIFFWGKNIYSGEYEFSPGANIIDVTKKLVTRGVKYRKVTIPGGLTIYQIGQILENSLGLMGSFPYDIPEGALFPETYFYTYGDNINLIIKSMKKAMTETINNLTATRRLPKPISNTSELIILASIVEKEAKLEEEKPIIASVYLNRLKIGMRLQSCPTALYAVTKGGRNPLTRKPSKEDMKIDSSYNTYKVANLPPSPIACPSKSSIEAVLNPSATEYLYFVVCDAFGGHKFAASYQQHLKNIKAPECVR